jgi:hypothetical protein
MSYAKPMTEEKPKSITVQEIEKDELPAKELEQVSGGTPNSGTGSQSTGAGTGNGNGNVTLTDFNFTHHT